MEVLITYDVATESSDGRRRLRRVAKICEGYGQRVHLSVFECIVNAGELELLIHRLTAEIDATEDSLRIYRLREPRNKFLQIIGKVPAYDLREPLVL